MRLVLILYCLISTLKSASRRISEAKKLGHGGFGPVYKDKLPDGKKVAVKRLSSTSGQGLAELGTEVILVAKLLHRNLVRLLGFCLMEVWTKFCLCIHGARVYQEWDFSVKSEVYSFGILVLELLAGEKNSHFRNLENIKIHAWQQWSNGTALEIMDPALGNQWPKHEALKCIHIGLLCVQDAASDRPTMSEIVTMLNSYIVTFPAAT